MTVDTRTQHIEDAVVLVLKLLGREAQHVVVAISPSGAYRIEAWTAEGAKADAVVIRTREGTTRAEGRIRASRRRGVSPS